MQGLVWPLMLVLVLVHQAEQTLAAMLVLRFRAPAVQNPSFLHTACSLHVCSCTQFLALCPALTHTLLLLLMQNAKQMEVTIPWITDEQSAHRMRLYQRSRQSCAQRSADMGNIYLDDEQRLERMGRVYEMPTDRCAGAAGLVGYEGWADRHACLAW